MVKHLPTHGSLGGFLPCIWNIHIENMCLWEHIYGSNDLLYLSFGIWRKTVLLINANANIINIEISSGAFSLPIKKYICIYCTYIYIRICIYNICHRSSAWAPDTNVWDLDSTPGIRVGPDLVLSLSWSYFLYRLLPVFLQSLKLLNSAKKIQNQESRGKMPR